MGQYFLLQDKGMLHKHLYFSTYVLSFDINFSFLNVHHCQRSLKNTVLFFRAEIASRPWEF